MKDLDQELERGTRANLSPSSPPGQATRSADALPTLTYRVTQVAEMLNVRCMNGDVSETERD